jgi:hypothetical protein
MDFTVFSKSRRDSIIRICIYPLSFFISLYILILPANAADNFADMLVYRGGGNAAIPEVKTRQNGAFSAESTASNVGASLHYIRLAQNPNPLSNEKVLCTRDSSSDVNCQVWDGTTWGNLVEVTTNDGGSQGFDVAYENQSRRAMVCFRGGVGNTPSCRIWNGSAWGSVFSANNNGGAITTIKLIPEKDTNYIALVTKDSGNDVNVQIWNGSTFSAVTEVDADGGSCSACLSFDGAWERNQQDFVFTWFNDGTDRLYAREYDKSGGWGALINNVITGLSTSDNVHVRTVANNFPGSNDILTAIADDDNTLTANYWNGSSWGSALELNANIGTVESTNHLFDIAYEQNSDNDAVISYGKSNTGLRFRVWDIGTLVWGANKIYLMQLKVKTGIF